MLAKLIKYDLKYILKSVSIYIVILLICAVCFNITSYDTSCEVVNDIPVCSEAPVLLQIFHTIFWNAMFAVIIGLFLNAAIRTWARFKINFFSDESYFTHTLPISNKTLWTAKFLSAVIITIIVITAIAVSFGILQLVPTGKNFMMSLGIGAPGTTPLYYVVFILTIFTQLLYSIMCGLTGITIGNRTGNNGGLRAVICGFAIYLLGVLIMLGCFLIWSTFDDGIHAMLFSGMTSQSAMALTGEGFIDKALTAAGIVYTAMIAALYFVNQKLLSHGIDID